MAYHLAFNRSEFLARWAPPILQVKLGSLVSVGLIGSLKVAVTGCIRIQHSVGSLSLFSWEVFIHSLIHCPRPVVVVAVAVV